MSVIAIKSESQNTFEFSNGVKFSSDFDNGNMAACELGKQKDEYKIWTAPDCVGTQHERLSKANAWFYFTITGLDEGCNLKVCVVNASNHVALYKHDMRPVVRSNSTNQKWVRIKNSVKFVKNEDGTYLTRRAC
jgi:hypothetical protein